MDSYLRGYLAKEATDAHTVVPGDTMGALAKRRGVTLDQVVGANPGIKDPNKIRPGDVIRFPSAPVQPPVQPPAQPPPKVHPAATLRPVHPATSTPRRRMAVDGGYDFSAHLDKADTTDALKEWPQDKFTRHWEGAVASNGIHTAYPDPLDNKLYTIGYGATTYADGRKIRPGDTITESEALKLKEHHINRAVRSAPRLVPRFNEMPPDIQRNFVDMVYNLGDGGFLNFKKMRAALETGDYSRAAHEMYDSKWFDQVGRRADHHVTALQRWANTLGR